MILPPIVAKGGFPAIVLVGETPYGGTLWGDRHSAKLKLNANKIKGGGVRSSIATRAQLFLRWPNSSHRYRSEYAAVLSRSNNVGLAPTMHWAAQLVQRKGSGR
jgi:hypothetical protein